MIEFRTEGVYIKASKASEVVEILQAMNEIGLEMVVEEEQESPEGPLVLIVCPDCETEPTDADIIDTLVWKCSKCGTEFSAF